MDFASFLIQKIKNIDNINNIILFGSVAREEADKTSDIDIFIDVVKENAELENEVNSHLQNFLDSAKYRNYWKMLGIENEIKLTIGKLGKWTELKPAIISNGMILYGKFKPDVKDGLHVVYFIWENIKPNSKRVLFNKQLLGYKQNKKFYQGFILLFTSLRQIKRQCA